MRLIFILLLCNTAFAAGERVCVVRESIGDPDSSGMFCCDDPKVPVFVGKTNGTFVTTTGWACLEPEQLLE